MQVKPLFDFGAIVYLKTDIKQLPRVVTGYKLNPSGSILYELTQAINETFHFAFEISDKIDAEIIEQYKEA